MNPTALVFLVLAIVSEVAGTAGLKASEGFERQLACPGIYSSPVHRGVAEFSRTAAASDLFEDLLERLRLHLYAAVEGVV
jgi:hypothetical protein